MSSSREATVKIALSYVGTVKGSSKHKALVNAFNSVKPHGEVARTSYPWCAIAVSAWEILAGNKAIAPLSMSCSAIISYARKMGIWKESDAFIPSMGDYILYDWNDSGRGDNTGSPDHVGMVYAVDKNYIYVVEGNKGSGSVCGKRAIARNGRYIRGFVHINYTEDKPITHVTVDGSWGINTTRLSQKVLKTTVDGIISGQSKEDKKYLVACETSSWDFASKGGSSLIRAIQKLVGASVDGYCGINTVKAMQKFLKTKGYYNVSIDGYLGTGTVKAWQMYINGDPIPKLTKREKLANKAVELAYSSECANAKYPTGKPTSAFKKALNKAYPNRTNWGDAPKVGASCDVFVGVCLHASGVDTEFPRGLDDQQPYLKKHTEKYKEIALSEVKNGDIITYRYNSGSGHIWIYYNGKAIHAHIKKWYGRISSIGNRKSKTGKKWIKAYRVIG